MSQLHYFGIRHHGPGCARSLLAALAAWQPDCILLEGPPEAQDLLAFVLAADMQPPVALLTHATQYPEYAVYHPFAEFSPEWQALCWSQQQDVPLRLMDLPLTHWLALDKAEREAQKAAEQSVQADSETNAEPTQADEAAEVTEDAGDETQQKLYLDPLDWYAHAAGYADGESWWNQRVEERGASGEAALELFAAINEAMCALRTDLGAQARPLRRLYDSHIETLREAQMRQTLHVAQKDGFARIAVICGAWHLAALQEQSKASADAALLKGLPKLKVQTTWVPWTYRHLTAASGYGAGIAAPGWYAHLWHSGVQTQSPHQRSIGWLARVAALMRARDLDCSSAHLIEATRLAESLAALRQCPEPGLPELHEACQSVLTLGDAAALDFIEEALLVGERMGQVPATVPTVPLQRDLGQQQKSLRIKPEAVQKTLDLDLRQPQDLARSHLLHRLHLLGIDWGEVAQAGRSKGTFHEVWHLQWQPEFALRVIEASQWGQTVARAACACAIAQAEKTSQLGELAQLLDRVLLAALADAVQPLTQVLKNRAAVQGDVLQLLDTLPPLANTWRYGSVRSTDSTLVAHVLDGLMTRAAIGLPLACQNLADDAAQTLRQKILDAHTAIALRASAEHTAGWQRALGLVARAPAATAGSAVGASGVHALLQGLAVRLLLDAQIYSSHEVAQALSLHLSSASEPAAAAAWLEGFLNQNAMVLLHDAQVWQLVDGWLAQLHDEHFVCILPLIRRTFSAFSASERRDLAQKAKQSSSGKTSASAMAELPWNEALLALPLPYLRRILALSPAVES